MGIIDFENRTRWIRDYNIAKTCTPIKIAKDMVSLIDEKYFNPDSKFLDIYCKSGTILEVIKDRLMDSKSMIEAFPNQRDRWYHILNHQIYGLVWEDVGIECEEMSNINVFGTYVNSNIKTFKIASTNKKDAYKILDNITFFKDEIQKIFGEKDMKFNIVVGNPPYNSDAYIDFVNNGYKLAESIVSMIIPAQWTAKPNDKNNDFRNNIVPHIEKIVYYPDATECFSIVLSGGVCYFKLNKGITYNNKTVKVISNGSERINDSWNLDNNIKLDATDTDIKILSKVRKFKRLYDVGFKPKCNYFKTKMSSTLDYTDIDSDSNICLVYGMGKDKQQVRVSKQSVKDNYDDVFKYKAITSVRTWEHSSFTGMLLGPNYIPNGGHSVVLGVGSKEYCNSVLHFYNTKAVYWLVKAFYGGSSSMSNLLVDSAFSLVPYLGPMDHVWTDQEVYEKLGLTVDEIEYIENRFKNFTI